MNDEIDLQQYIRPLLRHWPWILGIALLSAIVAGGYTIIKSEPFQTEAWILVTETMEQSSDVRVLATSLEVMQAFNAVLNTEADQEVIETFRQDLELVTVQTPGSNLIVLRVRSMDARFAAQAANAWVRVFVEWISELYGEGSDALTALDEQLAVAQTALQDAERNYIAVQSLSRSEILSTHLWLLHEELRNELALERELNRYLQAALQLQDNLDVQNAESLASYKEKYVMYMLQVAPLQLGISSPLEITVNQEEIRDLNGTVGDQLIALGQMIADLEVRIEVKPQVIDGIQEEILTMQADWQEEERVLREASHQRDLRDEDYASISRQIAELKAELASGLAPAQIVSEASVPGEPPRPSLVRVAVLAGVIGFMIGIMGVIMVNYLRGNLA